MSGPMDGPAKANEWTRVEERGSDLGIRIVVVVLRLLGYTVARWLLQPIAWYFHLTGRAVRTASSQYFARLHAAFPDDAPAPGFLTGFRHVRTFAELSLDRFILFSKKRGRFTFETEGTPLVEQLHRERRGCLFIGGHVGSFDALRALSAGFGVKVNAVMYLENARRFNRLLAAMGAEADVNIIELQEGSVEAVMDLQARIGRGEIVALLGDRFHPKARSRSVTCSFLGADAPFPAGPWQLAAVLGCPVLLVAGWKKGPTEYRCEAHLLCEKVELPRNEYDAALSRYVKEYAAFLEGLCRRAPYQWFNFFDFWSSDGTTR